MGKTYKQLNEKLKNFISEQKIFFVASATEAGRVNLSPKGYDTLRIIDDNHILYLDYPGSGNETARHIAAEGRLTVMFTSFGEKPQILRLYGKGEVVSKEAARFDELFELFSRHERTAVRQIIVVSIEEIETSCGFGTPYFEYKGERENLERWAKKEASKGPLGKCLDGIKETLKSAKDFID